ncbi:MAG: hypothetical protein ACLT9X_00235 [Parabacteroides merdae]
MSNDVVSRIKELMSYYSINSLTLSKELGYKSSEKISRLFRDGGAKPSYDIIYDISNKFEINTDWLITGRGSMLKSEGRSPRGEQEEVLPAKKNLIPFYDDVSTIGGLNDRVANTDPNSPSEWIDAGDWFPEATAAIRHYGDSMVEYSSGSILALRRVNDQRLIMNGRNYVIETSEYRVTKQLQDDGDHFMAYSTNRETYPDGRQIHAPFSIPKDAIRYIYLVLGCVTKEYSNGAIQIRK